MTGQQFERWTVLAQVDRKAKNGAFYWSCRCVCGSEKEVATPYLVHGKSKSCGCLSAEVSRKRAFRHGLSDKSHPGNKQYMREAYDRHKYGLEPEHKRAMLDRQNGGCAICSYRFGQKTGNMHVDHCHETGEVRVLLCNGCNTAIGLLCDDPDRMASAVNYVKSFKNARAR